MVIRKLLEEALNTLRKSEIENAMFEANLIVRTVLELSPIDMVLSYKKEVEEDKIKRVCEFLKRRSEGEPLQYILGVQEFMGLEFLVNPDVLVPRADTETLVEAVLSQNKGMNILDICTGSGCIALSIAHFNKNAFVIGLDISDEAIALAEKNAQKLGLSKRVRFEKRDILSDMPNGVFDVVVSNPPYIKTKEIATLQKEVRLYEPHIALDGGEDGLDFYRRIIKISPMLLQKGGKLFLEVGYDQAKEVSDMMKENFQNIKIIKDLCGIQRVVKGEVTA